MDAKNYTCLWSNENAEEAVRFYLSISKHSNVGTITRTVTLELGFPDGRTTR